MNYVIGCLIILLIVFACYGLGFAVVQPVIAELLPDASPHAIGVITVLILLIVGGVASGSRSKS